MNKKLYLEFFRGTASVFILGWHIAFMAPTGRPTKLTGYWGTDALMIFFMLSGIVINLTESRKPKPAMAFLKNRLIRLYPVFIVGMLLALIALPITGNPLPGGRVIAGNFLMLSTMPDYMGYIVPSIKSNLAVWTLAFESGFYLIFALTIGRNQKRSVFIWFIASLIAIPLFFIRQEKDFITHIIAVLAFSSIWLIGYYIYQYRDRFYADRNAAFFCLGILPLISRMHFSDNFYDPFKYFILSLFAIPFLRYCLQTPGQGFKISFKALVIPHLVIVASALIIRYMPLSNAIAYSTLPYVYMGIAYLIARSGFKQKFIAFVNKTGEVLGKHSYALYITHFPIVFTYAALVHNVALYVILVIPTVVLVTYLTEDKLQPLATRYWGKKKTAEPTEAKFTLPDAVKPAFVTKTENN